MKRSKFFSFIIIVYSFNLYSVVNGSKAKWSNYPNIIKFNITKVKKDFKFSKFEFPAPNLCTGFVINKDYALTAAHCLDYEQDEASFGNRLSYAFNHKRRQYSFSFVIHPMYKSLKKVYHAKKLSFFKLFSDPNGEAILLPEKDPALFEKMLQEVVQSMKNNVRYDIALIHSKGAFWPIVKEGQASLISTNPSHGLEYSAGTKVTLWGFGHDQVKHSKRKEAFDSVLRYGYNQIKEIDNGVIVTEGTNNILNAVSWAFNDDSMVSWGDSGGPLTLKGSDGQKVIGINSSLNPYHVIQEAFIDSNWDRGENFYTDLKSDVVKNFINKYTKQY